MPQRKSKQHKAVCNAIRRLYSRITLKEEYAIKHNGKTYLFDIYIPRLDVAFEVQGEQHLAYNPFMHNGNRGKYVAQVKRDVEKVEACLAAGIKLIYVFPKDKVTAQFIEELILGEDDDRIATSTK